MLDTLKFPLRVPYDIVRSRRARRGRLIIQDDHVRVVIPRGGNERLMLKFLAEKEDWALGALAENRRRARLPAVWPQIRDGARFQIWGKWYELQLVEAKGLRILQNDSKKTLTIHAPLKTSMRRLHAALIEHFKERIIHHTTQIVDEMADFLRKEPKQLRIKQMRTRWGSCSTRGIINLNLALIHVPYKVFRYVVIHELAHLRFPHHQKTYWMHVEDMCPDFMKYEEYLRTEGKNVLMSFIKTKQSRM